MTDLVETLRQAGYSKRQVNKVVALVGPESGDARVMRLLDVSVPGYPGLRPGVVAATRSTLHVFGWRSWARVFHGHVDLDPGRELVLMGNVERSDGWGQCLVGVRNTDGEETLVALLDRDDIEDLAENLNLKAGQALVDFDRQDAKLLTAEVEDAHRSREFRRKAEFFRDDPEVRRRSSEYRALVTAQATVSYMLDGAEALVRTVARTEGRDLYPLEAAAVWTTMPLVFTIGNFREYEARDAAWLFEALKGLMPDLTSIDQAANFIETAEAMGMDEAAVKELIRTFNEQAVIARAQGDPDLAVALAGFAPFVYSMQSVWPNNSADAQAIEP